MRFRQNRGGFGRAVQPFFAGKRAGSSVFPRVWWRTSVGVGRPRTGKGRHNAPPPSLPAAQQPHQRQRRRGSAILDHYQDGDLPQSGLKSPAATCGPHAFYLGTVNRYATNSLRTATSGLSRKISLSRVRKFSQRDHASQT